MDPFFPLLDLLDGEVSPEESFIDQLGRDGLGTAEPAYFPFRLLEGFHAEHQLSLAVSHFLLSSFVGNLLFPFYGEGEFRRSGLPAAGHTPSGDR